jgi:hypothetical protein
MLVRNPALCGVASAVSIPLLRETYSPVIRERLLLKEGDSEKAIQVENAGVAKELAERDVIVLSEAATMTKAHFIWVNLTRPIVLLTRSMICFMLSLYTAL